MNPLRWAKAEMLHLAWKRGRYSPPDRRLLKEEILPAIAADAAQQRILSVGVAWYTKADTQLFGNKTLVTIDVDPERRAFGASRHIVGDVRELDRCVDETFDAILMNGVIGYGLNAPDDVERALRACAARLRAGGMLVLGVNEEKPTHVDPTSVPAHALFEPSAFGRWPAGRVMIPVPFRERTHTFLFWRRR